MAFVLDKILVNVRFRGYDTTGASTDRLKRFTYNGALGVDTATDIATFIGTLEAVTDAEIVGYSWQPVYYEDTPVAESTDMHKELVLSLFDDTAPTKKHTLSLVAPNADALTADGLKADVGNASLLAFLDNFESDGYFTISDGESIASVGQVAASRVRSVRSGRSYTD